MMKLPEEKSSDKYWPCFVMQFFFKQETDAIAGCYCHNSLQRELKKFMFVSQHLSNASSLFRTFKTDTRPVAECNTKLQLLSYVNWLDESKYATRIREKPPGNKSKS